MKWLIMPCVIISIVAILAGCSSSGGGAPFTPRDLTAPTITDFTLTPPASGWRAGACRVNVSAADNVGVTGVIARISGPGATTDAIPIPPAGNSRYAGDVPVPPNTNSDGTANTYFITVWAQDAEGNNGSSDKSLSVVVPAPDGPLPPPVW